jgi:adenine-specific DNA-methyltransferase
MNIQSALLSNLDRQNAKRNGVVYTPQKVAHAVVHYISTKLRGNIPRVLEPSCGDGAFLKAIYDILPLVTVNAIDIDPAAIRKCRETVKGPNYRCGNFFDIAASETEGLFDLVIGNPPYIRPSNYSEKIKEDLNLLSKRVDYPKSNMRNTWAAFVLACEPLLDDEGVLAFVVPYELITVGYAKSLRDRISEKFERVDVFIPDEKAFNEIDQDAVLLVACKRSQEGKGFFLNQVRSLDYLEPNRISKVSAEAIDRYSTNMKSFLLDSEQLNLVHKLRSKIKKIGDYCNSSAGTVTAANDFFILNHEDVERLGLFQFARPIVQKASYIQQNPRFDQKDFERLRDSGKPCYLLDFGGHDAEGLSKEALVYISGGEEMGLDKRYKCRHRRPWYRVPVVPSSDGFFFKRSHLIPRIISNSAEVLTTDTAYQIRMFEGYHVDDLCVSFYNTLTLLFSEIDGRFYGGGVLELTPKEFRNIPLVFTSVDDGEYRKFVACFEAGEVRFADMLLMGDNMVTHQLALTDSDWTIIQRAHQTVRDHRLRHGTNTSLKQNSDK